jgi:hypothetical protein
MADRQAQNKPPQTGLIDFLRRVAAVDNHDFRDAFVADPEGLMTLVGLSEEQKNAIRTADNAAITALVAREFKGGVSPTYIRTATAVARNLNYQFPDEKNLPGGPAGLVSDLRRSIARLSEQLDQLEMSLE